MSKLVEMSFLEEQKEEDRTYLAKSEERKHNRLVGREKEAFKRLTSAADTKWNRELKALKIKSDDAIKLAQSTGQIEYYKDALKIQSDLMQKEIEIQRFYLQTGQFEVASPENQERKFKAYQSSIERLRAAQETFNKLDSERRVISGIPPSIGLETEDFDINAAVNMAAEEIIRAGEEEGATGLISVPTMTDQIKSINDMLERNKMPIMTSEQEASFRELVEAQVRGIGGRQMPSKVSTALGVKPDMSIYEQQTKEAAARERVTGSLYDLDLALQPGGKDPTKYIEGAPDAVSEDAVPVPDDEVPGPSTRFRVPDKPLSETLGGKGISSVKTGIQAAFKWLIEGLREGVATKEPLPFFTLPHEKRLEVSKLSAEGRLFWTTLVKATEEVGLEAALDSLAEQFEALSNADKEIMHGLNSDLAPNESSSKNEMIKELIAKFSKAARV